MSDMRELYQELILDHSRSPRNFRVLEEANRRAQGDNPLCGDSISVQLRLSANRIEDAGFRGHGCAICMASASTMTETLKGMDVDQARALFDRFRAMVTGRSTIADVPDKLGAFAGVAAFPMRVKCATLPWHTLLAALDQNQAVVSTEVAGEVSP